MGFYVNLAIVTAQVGAAAKPTRCYANLAAELGCQIALVGEPSLLSSPGEAGREACDAGYLGQGQSIIESAAASAKSDTAGHINFLAGIIKHGSPTAPHFIGMQCKIEDIDTRAEPRLVEKNRRRARPRRFPPPIRPLCMDAATRRQVREIIALAAAAPISTAEFNAALATWPPPRQLEPRSLLLSFGYRVIFAVEMSDGLLRRHLALSHPRNPSTLHMLVGLVALAEEFKLARRVDYTSWSEMQGTAHWFHLAEPV